MTNTEMLKSNLLDILFEHRNKEYGAYELRRTYHHRLWVAMGAASSVILLFILLSNIKGTSNERKIPVIKENGPIVITTVEWERERPQEPEPLRQPAKPIETVATEQFTSVINLKPDHIVTATLPPFSELENAKPSDITVSGKPPGDIPVPNYTPAGTGKTGTETPVAPKDPFLPDERGPEFPGGPEALRRFLSGHLNTPEELEAGEKKSVQIRFKVDKDGSVNGFEIVNSGGPAFDNEVLRVCRKMPRWVPARQNGTYVAVGYLLPVTFIGVEQ